MALFYNPPVFRMGNAFDHPPDRQETDSSKWRRYRGRDILPLWVADMDYPVAPAIAAAIRERADHGVFGYTDCDEETVAVVCDYFGRVHGWEIRPEWIVFSPGLGVAIHAMCRLTEEAGDEILTPCPIYHVFRVAPGLAGRVRIDLPMGLRDGEWTLDPGEISRRCGPRTKVFQLCNPHNPNGKVFSRAELERIAEECLRNNLLICADEVHADLILDPGLRHVPIASVAPEIAARTITLASPSKAYNVAGLNFAVAVIPDPDVRARYRATTRGLVISHLNPFGIAAAKAAWGGACDAWLAEALGRLRENRDRLAQGVRKTGRLSMAHLASTYLAWIDVSALGLADPPGHFEAHGLGMSAGETFGDRGHMRLNFACSRATLEEAVARLGAACK